jgi:hypothetical protein
MADATVNIIIKATDRASGALGKFKSGIAELGKSVPGLGAAMNLLGNPITLVAGGIATVAAEMGQAVVKAQEYALSMGDLAKVWGTSVEEASKLVQVADDVRISQDALAASMRIAMKQGVEPTIAGIKEAAQTYQSFTSTQERAAWAAKTFGRNWTEVARLLELTPDQIDASTKAAEKFGLVIGRDNVEAAKKLFAAMDDLEDAQEGLTLQAGTKLIPIWTEVIKTFNKGTTAGFEIADELGTIADLILHRLYPNLMLLVEGAGSWVETIDSSQGSMDGYIQRLDTLATSADDAAEANNRIALSITEISKTSAAKTAMDILTAAFKDGSIDGDVYAVKMSDIMRNWLDMPMAQVTASIALQTIAQDLASGKINALEASSAILGVGAAADAIDGKHSTVTVDYVTNYTSSGAPLPGNPKAPTRPRRALGGPVSAGQEYLIGERGPEMFIPSQNGRIIPNVTNNYGSNNNADLIAAIRNNRIDYYQLARVVRDQLEKMG